MLGRIMRGIKIRWFIFHLQRANSMMAKRNFEGAIHLLSKLKPPQKYKSICNAQIGDCFLHIGKLREAEAHYQLAKKIELSWKGRENKQNEKYIIAYCDFFLATIFAREGDDEGKDLYPKLLLKLHDIPASSALKNRLLPAP